VIEFVTPPTAVQTALVVMPALIEAAVCYSGHGIVGSRIVPSVFDAIESA